MATPAFKVHLTKWSRRLSLALFALALVQFIVGITSGWLAFSRRGHRSNTAIEAGLVHFTWNDNRTGSTWPWTGWSTYTPEPAPGMSRLHGLLAWPRRGVHGIGGWRFVTIPLGTSSLAFTIIGTAALLAPRLHRSKPDHCSHCGYDLHGLPSSTPESCSVPGSEPVAPLRCPECGHPSA